MTGPTTFIQHAANVASSYGFRPLREFERALPDMERTNNAHSFENTAQTCFACARNAEPALGFYATPTPTNVPRPHDTRDTGEFGLHIAGSPESMSEALLLKTLATIVTEWGCPIVRARVNTLGDRDSRLRFERELTVYLRRHARELDDNCRATITANPLAVYSCTNAQCRAIIADAPRAIHFLSEKSRVHFRDVLEKIERLDIPYELDHTLVDHERQPRTIFALDLAQEDPTIIGCACGRYDEYVRKLANRRDGYAVHASIFFHKKNARGTRFTFPATAMPKIYFVQLGARARLQSLAVADMLRHANVRVAQSFDAGCLSVQLARARELNVPNLLIIGQREALDGTITVRSMADGSQTNIPLAKFPRFLKTMHV